MIGGRVRTGNNRQERVINVSWIVAVGVCTAFYFFYQWIQSIVGGTLHRIGNNIVDTHLPGDDDDIKPPLGFKYKFEDSNAEIPKTTESDEDWIDVEPKDEDNGPAIPGQFGGHDTISTGRSSAFDAARSQGWSFRGI